jgi:excinuclease ABC subunit C
VFSFDPALYPARSGVYLFRDTKGKVLYVGKARKLRQRLRSYAAGGDGRATITVMLRRAASLECIETASELDALILENNLIKQHSPRYNILLKDDKSYPYIRVTRELYPRIFVTRKRVKDGSRYFGPYTEVKGLRAFLRSARASLGIRECDLAISQESIDKGRHQICLDYHIGKCFGPCEGRQSVEDYGRAVNALVECLRGRQKEWRQREEAAMADAAGRMDYEQAALHRDALKALDSLAGHHRMEGRPEEAVDVIALAREDNRACAVLLRVREGRLLGRFHNFLAGSLEDDEAAQLKAFLINYYSQSEEFPREIWLSAEVAERELVDAWLKRHAEETGSRAPRLHVPQKGEKRGLIDLARQNARGLLDEQELRRMRRERIPEAVRALARDLHMKGLPRRIEGFDISHFGGKATVASLVVFQDGRPLKRDYRHFRIREVEGIDDFASMEEVVRRRYSRLVEEGRPLPDLILIDGGKGQLGRACKVLKELGIGEQPVIGLAKRLEEVFVPGEELPLNVPKDSASNRLLQHVRNEAHRFAITFNRKLRAKEAIPDPLAGVRNLGPRLRDRLLERFGGLSGLKAATREELLAVEGMGPVLVERLMEFMSSS